MEDEATVRGFCVKPPGRGSKRRTAPEARSSGAEGWRLDVSDLSRLQAAVEPQAAALSVAAQPAEKAASPKEAAPAAQGDALKVGRVAVKLGGQGCLKLVRQHQQQLQSPRQIRRQGEG